MAFRIVYRNIHSNRNGTYRAKVAWRNDREIGAVYSDDCATETEAKSLVPMLEQYLLVNHLPHSGKIALRAENKQHIMRNSMG